MQDGRADSLSRARSSSCCRDAPLPLVGCAGLHGHGVIRKQLPVFLILPVGPRIGHRSVSGRMRRGVCRVCMVLSLLLTAEIGASQPASCQDAALRPVLGAIRPSRIPWMGGVITVSGSAFDHRIDVSLGAHGDPGSGSRQCTVLFVNHSVLTCLAPPSEYAVAGVSARIDTCESAQVLLLEYVGWPWQKAWRWHTLGTSVDGGGPAPSPRIGHTLSADGDGNLVLYGGLADAGVLGDVWVLKKLSGQQRDGDETWVWSARQPRGDAPPRTEHVAGVLGGCLYIFGGWNAQTVPASSSAALDGADDSEVTTGMKVEAKFEANTYALNLSASASGSNPLAWARVESGNVQPQPRRGACSAASDKLGLLMYGGHDSLSRQVRLVDTHLYRMASPRQKFSKSQCPGTFVLKIHYI